MSACMLLKYNMYEVKRVLTRLPFQLPFQGAYVILVGVRIVVTAQTTFQAQNVHAKPSQQVDPLTLVFL